jgi:hypothetical protein
MEIMSTQNRINGDDAAEALGDGAEVVPIPSSDTQADHDRVRRSNDRDQRLEREGKASAHNEGYDEAADGPPAAKVANIVDEP